MKIIIKLLELLLFPFFLISFLFTFLFWDIILKLSPKKYLNTLVSLLNLCIKNCLRILGTKFEVLGAVPKLDKKSCIIVCNHQSMFDMPWLYSVFKEYSPRYVAKTELSKNIPAISVCLRKHKSALINRKNSHQALDEISNLSKRMNLENHAVIIFPEGTRARDGKLKRFKLNGLKELIKTESNKTTPLIIPVAIDGTWKLNKNKFGPMPIFSKLRMKIGETIEAKEINNIEKIIAGLLEEIRAKE